MHHQLQPHHYLCLQLQADRSHMSTKKNVLSNAKLVAMNFPVHLPPTHTHTSRNITKGHYSIQTWTFVTNLQLLAVGHLWVQSVIVDISEWSSQIHNQTETLFRNTAVHRAEIPDIRIHITRAWGHSCRNSKRFIHNKQSVPEIM